MSDANRFDVGQVVYLREYCGEKRYGAGVFAAVVANWRRVEESNGTSRYEYQLRHVHDEPRHRWHPEWDVHANPAQLLQKLTREAQQK